jgi:hypothetical protein
MQPKENIMAWNWAKSLKRQGQEILFNGIVAGIGLNRIRTLIRAGRILG